MAIKNYRVNYGVHYVPNLDFKPGSSDPALSHIAAAAGSVIALEEERALPHTKSLGQYKPKLSQTTDKPRIEELGSSGLAAALAQPAPPPEGQETPRLGPEVTKPAPAAAPEPPLKPAGVPQSAPAVKK